MKTSFRLLSNEKIQFVKTLLQYQERVLSIIT